MHEYELCVSSNLTNLAQIAEFVSEQALLVGMDDEQTFDIQMAVDEACSNIIEHAYEGREGGQVRVCCYLEEGFFVVRINDQGKPFDPTQVPEPDVTAPLEDRGVGGLGIFFMRKLMDRVEFCYDPLGGNQVVMRKARRSGET